MAFSALIESWRPFFNQLAGDIPIEFLLQWLKVESGGNSCDIGSCKNGVPQENGPFQLDTSNAAEAGTTFDNLRAGCTGCSQTLPILSDDQKAEQAQSGINYVTALRAQANQNLANVGANWPETTSDFWKLVKSGHGSKCIGNELLPVVTQILGRPPINWNEFANVGRTVPASSLRCLAPARSRPSTQGLTSRLDDVLANADKTGAAFPGGPLPGVATVPDSVTPAFEESHVKTFFLAFGAIAGLAVAGWGALYIAKRLAIRHSVLGKRSRKQLGTVDEKLIQRTAQLISYNVSKKDIRDRLVEDGYSDQDVYLAYQAAKMHIEHQDEPLPHLKSYRLRR